MEKMQKDKHNFEKVLARMALVERKAENDLSSEFLECLSSKEAEDCLSYLSSESQRHYDKLLESVDNLPAAVDKYRGKFEKVEELYTEYTDTSGTEDLCEILRDQLTVEIYAKSQYKSLLDMLSHYEGEEVLEDGEISFEVGELKETVREIEREEEEHITKVQEALDALKPSLDS